MGDYIGEPLSRLMTQHNTTPQQLAAAVGIKADSVINLRNNNKRAGLTLMRNIASFFGVSVTAFVDPTAKPVQHLGSCGQHGVVTIHTESPSMPGSIDVTSPIGDFLPGDILWMRGGEYTPSKWLLVRGLGGGNALCLGVIEDGIAYLRTGHGDDVRYRADVHEVVGVVDTYERKA